jgi:hypothetical protein
MTTSYAAHLVMAVRVAAPENGAIPLYETVVLIAAESDDEAMREACAIGRADAADPDPTFRWGGHPARLEFVGVRKLISCQPRGLSGKIESGAELTYSQMSVRSEDDLRKLVEGEPVEVVYEE